LFPCPHCKTKLKSKKNLDKHVEAFAGQEGACPVCGETMVACKLQNHVRMHKRDRTDELEARKQCDECGEKFRHAVSLRRHMHR
jgi:hypothetical protein